MSETEAPKELRSVSPSSIDTFDDTTPFGCNRKWWFKYPGGQKDVTSTSQLLGSALGLRNEKYLKGEGSLLVGTEFPEEILLKSDGLFARGKPWLDANLMNTRDPTKRASWVLGVEMPVPEGYSVGGVPVSRRSASDVVVATGIVDWKTTSDKKWMKTPTQLKKNTQMLMYADAFHRKLLEAGEKVSLTHGYYLTKGAPAFIPVATEITLNELDERLAGHIVPLVGEMKKTYLAPTARDVKPNRQICWNCSYRGICPSDKVNPLMGIFANKFSKPSGNEAKVTPPDAPASDPAKAANPVEGKDIPPEAEKKQRRMLIVDAAPERKEETPATEEKTKVESKADKMRREMEAAIAKAEAEEKAEAEAAAKKAAEAVEAAKAAVKEESEKKGPGRPAGAKNKSTLAKEAREALAENGPVFVSTKGSFGMTINLGVETGAVRFEVTHEVAYYDGDAEGARKMAVAQAKKDVEAEAEAFMADFNKQSEKK